MCKIESIGVNNHWCKKFKTTNYTLLFWIIFFYKCKLCEASKKSEGLGKCQHCLSTVKGMRRSTWCGSCYGRAVYDSVSLVFIESVFDLTSLDENVGRQALSGFSGPHSDFTRSTVVFIGMPILWNSLTFPRGGPCHLGSFASVSLFDVIPWFRFSVPPHSLVVLLTRLFCPRVHGNRKKNVSF